MSNRVRERALELRLEEALAREQQYCEIAIKYRALADENQKELVVLNARIDYVKHLINEYCCYCDYNGSYDTELISLKRETLAKLADILDGKEEQ